MDISIIIPTSERNDIFNKSLESIYKATSHLNAEIIVVNDSKKSSPFIPESFSNVILYNKPNNSCTSARNFGANKASSPYLLFIDDDFIVHKDSIDKILFYLKKYPDRAFNLAWEYPEELYQAILKNQFGRYLTYCLKFTSLEDILKEQWKDNEMFLHPEGLGSGFFAIHKDRFLKIGGYNEAFTFAADRDMARRLQESNIGVYIIPFIKVYHNEQDKVHLKAFLIRRRFGIRKAVEYGIIPRHQYNKFQYGLLWILSRLKHFFFFLISIIPNLKVLDRLYFRIANILFIIFLYEGYMQRNGKS